METITIDNCPLCTKMHIYKLKVERSYVMKNMTLNDIYERERSVRITRLFNCPEKNETFQASLTLYDTSSGRIKSVEVMGISDETKD